MAKMNNKKLDLTLNLTDVFEEYRGKTNSFVNGYFILFDIINSTDRKDEFKYRWIEQTKLLYSSTKKFKKHLKGTLIKHLKRTLINMKEDVFLKVVGDSVFVFVPVPIHYQTTYEPSQLILNEVLSFNEFFADKKTFTDLLKLKIVLTFLTDIFLLKDENNKIIDVLGKGIDFSFRLEKFASNTHLIMNNIFYYSLGDIFPKYYKGVKVKRNIKGWSGLQSFYVLYREQDLRNLKLSNQGDDVYSEILKDVIRNKKND